MYQKEEPQPPGIPLKMHVDPVQFNNATLLEADMEAAVHHLPPFKAGRHTHLHAKRLKKMAARGLPWGGLEDPP